MRICDYCDTNVLKFYIRYTGEIGIDDGNSNYGKNKEVIDNNKEIATIDRANTGVNLTYLDKSIEMKAISKLTS